MCSGPIVAEIAIVGVDDVSPIIAWTVLKLEQDIKVASSPWPLTKDKDALVAISTDPQES